MSEILVPITWVMIIGGSKSEHQLRPFPARHPQVAADKDRPQRIQEVDGERGGKHQRTGLVHQNVIRTPSASFASGIETIRKRVADQVTEDKSQQDKRTDLSRLGPDLMCVRISRGDRGFGLGCEEGRRHVARSACS